MFKFEGDYQKQSGDYVIRSINHQMYLQKVTKSSVTAFVEKRPSLNEIEKTRWN